METKELNNFNFFGKQVVAYTNKLESTGEVLVVLPFYKSLPSFTSEIRGAVFTGIIQGLSENEIEEFQMDSEGVVFGNDEYKITVGMDDDLDKILASTSFDAVFVLNEVGLASRGKLVDVMNNINYSVASPKLFLGIEEDGVAIAIPQFGIEA